MRSAVSATVVSGLPAAVLLAVATCAPVFDEIPMAGGRTVIFRHDASGEITEFTLSESRVSDLRFRRE